ncbi:MAG: hypothetical protein ACAI44_06840 [Candidatus Sericytochromatia bacterium]
MNRINNQLCGTLMAMCSFVVVSTLTACGAPSVPPSTSIQGSGMMNNAATFNLGNIPVAKLVQGLQAKGENVTIADVGNGIQTGASFSLKLNFEDGQKIEDFAMKASSSGTSNSTTANITAVDVWLVDSAAAPTGTLTPAFGPFNVVRTGAGPYTIVFNNVTTSANKYYVAIRALNSGANITNIGSGASIAGAGNVYVSTGGGEGTGEVAVGAAPTYTVSNVTQLTVNLKLLDALGATIDSRTTITNGSTVPVGSVSAS